MSLVMSLSASLLAPCPTTGALMHGALMHGTLDAWQS